VRTAELDYDLPPELIAQHPASPRDHSRLLVYYRGRGDVEHRRFIALPSLLAHGDLLVYNDSRVLPARVFARKPTGGRVELLFLRRRGEVWEALARPSARLKAGTRLEPEGDPDSTLRLVEGLGGGRWLVENLDGVSTGELMERAGLMPLPPYIHEELGSPGEYQTVYARRPGSAAAPTAGLHFTDELMAGIREAGAVMAPLTLHIGLDTFRPVDEDELEGHRIHRESYSVPAETAEAVAAARRSGGRVIAVGTTTVRVLETVFGEEGAGGPAAPGTGGEQADALTGETGLFITPGYRFRAVDALLTNFHLPRSTLLALVMAFAGVEETRRLYRLAIEERYRFYSFGDAMLLL